MKVTVYGGSRPSLQDYSQAERLGKLLGQAGHTVVSGGYSGSMEAVSKGASEAGAHVVGVTCQQIEAWRPSVPNRWVKEELRCATLEQRLFTLIESSDAAIALPGGAGTLTEIALTWNMLFTEILPPRPLILVSKAWHSVFALFFEAHADYIPEFERHWLIFADNVDQAFSKLSS